MLTKTTMKTCIDCKTSLGKHAHYNRKRCLLCAKIKDSSRKWNENITPWQREERNRKARKPKIKKSCVDCNKSIETAFPKKIRCKECQAVHRYIINIINTEEAHFKKRLKKHGRGHKKCIICSTSLGSVLDYRTCLIRKYCKKCRTIKLKERQDKQNNKRKLERRKKRKEDFPLIAKECYPRSRNEWQAMNGLLIEKVLCFHNKWKCGNGITDGGIDGFKGSIPIQIKNFHSTNVCRNQIREILGTALLSGHKKFILISWKISKAAKKLIKEIKENHGITIQLMTCEEALGELLIK